MSHALLICTLSPDYLIRRGAYVQPHVAHVWAAMERGDMILGGVVGDPLESAMFLFRSAESAAEFARNDPYVAQKLFVEWRVVPWTTVPNSNGESVIPI